MEIILVKCDNDAVVQVLTNGRTHDAFLAACARNVWLETANCDIDATFVHVLGKNNQVANQLSKWQYTPACWQALTSYIPNPIWLPVFHSMLDLDNEYNVQ